MKELEKLKEMVDDVNVAEIYSHVEGRSVEQWSMAWRKEMLRLLAVVEGKAEPDQKVREIIDRIRRIGTPAIYEQLAEECAELSKAALKCARVRRGENPTPIQRKEAADSLMEEVGDVVNILYSLGLVSEGTMREYGTPEKLVRWADRIAEAEREEAKREATEMAEAQGALRSEQIFRIMEAVLDI